MMAIPQVFLFSFAFFGDTNAVTSCSFFFHQSHLFVSRIFSISFDHAHLLHVPMWVFLCKMQPLKDMREFGLNVPAWDAKFIDVELQMLFKLILVRFYCIMSCDLITRQ